MISYRSCTAYGRVKNIVCGMTERNVCLLRILDGERSQHPEKINKKVLDRIKIKLYDIKVAAVLTKNGPTK